MMSVDRRDINECKATLRENARQWHADGISSVTIVSALAETMTEVSVALMGPHPTIELLHYLDQKVQDTAGRGN